MAWLGDEVFLAGVNDLIRERRFATATLDDLLVSLSRRSGRDVRGWADAWLRTSGHDTLRVERDDAGLVVTHPGVRPHVVVAGVYDRDPDDAARLVLRDEVPVRLEPGRVIEPLQVGDERPAAVLLCHRDLTFASVRHDPETDDALRESLGSIPSTVARVVVWGAWRDRVRHAELAPQEFLARTTRNLADEADPIVVDAVLQFAQGVVVDRYLDDATRPGAAAPLRDLCRSLLARGREHDLASLRLVAARGLIAAAGEAEVDELQGWLADGAPGVALDEELRWRVVTRLASLGAIGADAIEAHLAAAPTQEAALHAVTARAARPDAEAKARAWASMTGVDDDAASTSVVRAAATGFWVPGQADLLAGYLPQLLPAAERVAAARGAWVMRRLLDEGWPWHVVDVGLLEAAEAVAVDAQRSSTVRRHVGDAAYEYRLAHTVRERWLPTPA